MSDENIVYVGTKHVMNYVEAIITQINMNGEVKIIARGLNIIQAIDATEIAKRTLSSEKIEVETIIGSEDRDFQRNVKTDENKKERKRRISTIIITIRKK